ncbi:MAG: PAS domain S-box protein [Candidatus Abyssobacteria bacterium SURF_17]|uniref:histidine kinase n=1 Tax=Candidatus Abyssobacteria bacterium SURF_17 TaxID=2093361 RepID=A0A419ER44_9BACT|nr:MAG: PAS domain S-box protein [Candidatus Abyssubacteria bacterium SURF_17]
MNEDIKTRRREVMRIGVMVLLLVAYGGLGVYFRIVLHTPIVYTHFAYIPIVLAGLWWGQKSIGIALLLAGMTFGFRLSGTGEGALWSDAARTLFFLTVASCIGFLSERVMKAQGAVRASEEKYKLLIDKSLAGIFVHRQGKIVFVNRRFCEMLGYEPHELLESSFARLIHEPDRNRRGELISERKDRAASDAHYECRFVSKDGEKIWVDLGSSMTSYEGEPAVLVNVYDITDRKEAEEKRQELLELSRRQEEQLVHAHRLAELGEMAASIAHEINQPLTAVKNFAKNTCYMIETNAGTPEDIRDNLHRIADQVDRASRIINQIRHLTRKSDRQFTLLDINSILRESVDFMAPQFRLHGIKVALELGDNLPLVMGDKIRLEQVFLNILANASQAMADTPERRLGIKTYLNTGSRPVVAEITDTGTGFTSEEGKKIFTPFYTTKQPGDGTGLGLSISLTIIKEHMGEIEAIGAPGVGSIFKVMLPSRNPVGIGEVEEND